MATARIHWFRECSPEYGKRYNPVLQELASRLKVEAIRLERELSGASGAHTFLASSEHRHGRTLPLVLKLGKAEVLESEIAGLRIAEQFFDGASYALEKKIERDGVVCIPMLLVGSDGETLRDWYADASAQQVEQVVRSLFDDVLRIVDRNVLRVNDNAFRLYEFDDESALERALRAIVDPIPTLVGWWRNAASRSARGSLRCLCHGDLHGGNVIVAGGKAHVIDFGRTGEAHAPRDLAKLEREFWLILLSSPACTGDVEQLAAAVGLVEPAGGDVDAEIDKARRAIAAVRASLGALCQDAGTEFEYRVALLAQFMFAAGNPRLKVKMRKAMLALADLLRTALEGDGCDPVPPAELEAARRNELTWRLAYSFLRLDQLPSGGWGKTLSGWMEALWQGDRGKVFRNPDMRTRGGTDFTSYALCEYVDFIEEVFGDSDAPPPGDFPVAQALKAAGGVADGAAHNLIGKIGYGGGIGVGLPGRAGAPAKRIRHTIMGLIAFLHAGRAWRYTAKYRNAISDVASYLRENLSEWRSDDSHPFGMYAVAVQLRRMLKAQAGTEQVAETDRVDLQSKLDDVLEPMAQALYEAPEYSPKPEGPNRGDVLAEFARPYHSFWRMERSNFLMYLPSLLSPHGAAFCRRDHTLESRIALCLRGMVEEIDIPFDEDRPTASLIHYHRDPGAAYGALAPGFSPRDWGLSAELASLLEAPAIQSLLESNGMERSALDARRGALRRALLATVDGWFRSPEIFEFAHSGSFARYLNLCRPDCIPPGAIAALDEQLEALRHQGITEEGLQTLVQGSIVGPSDLAEDEGRARAVVDMLVCKLASGDHTPDGTLVSEQLWRDRVDRAIETTRKFYDGPEGLQHGSRYADGAIATLVTRLRDVCEPPPADGERRALDLGCGPGQYAKPLQDEGFTVELVDNSTQMLRLACERLGLGVNTVPTRDIYEIQRDFAGVKFHLIYASAILIHVPPDRAPGLYETLHELLVPGGALFVSYKIADHTLIGRGERYFAYYANHAVPASMLEAAGFQIEEVALRWNRRNMHGDPKVIHWANFYCRKPEH